MNSEKLLVPGNSTKGFEGVRFCSIVFSFLNKEKYKKFCLILSALKIQPCWLLHSIVRISCPTKCFFEPDSLGKVSFAIISPSLDFFSSRS
jgi:hypothetical protein